MASAVEPVVMLVGSALGHSAAFLVLRVWGLGCRVYAFGFLVCCLVAFGLRLTVSDLQRVSDFCLRLRFLDIGSKVQRFWFTVPRFWVVGLDLARVYMTVLCLLALIRLSLEEELICDFTIMCRGVEEPTKLRSNHRGLLHEVRGFRLKSHDPALGLEVWGFVYGGCRVWDLARILKGSWDLVARVLRVTTFRVTFLPIKARATVLTKSREPPR